MAKIKLGALVTAISGASDGVVYSHNRFGRYTRPFVVPVNPATPKQTVIRSRLAALSQQWRTLTDGQRNLWGALANQLPATDAFGDSYIKSGQQLFIGYNQFRLTASLAVVTDAPTLDSAPNIQAGTVIVTGAASAASRVFTVAMNRALVATESVRVYATAPTSAGRSFFKKSDYRLIAVLAGPQSTPLNIRAAYATVFGELTPGIAGQRVSVKLLPISANGLPGSFSRSDAIATAV